MELQNKLKDIKWKKEQGDSEFISLSPGDEVVGIYVGKETNETYSDRYDYKIDIDGSGDIKKIGGTVIAKYLEEKQTGTPVKIVSKGQKKSAKGLEYNDYDVYFKE